MNVNSYLLLDPIAVVSINSIDYLLTACLLPMTYDSLLVDGLLTSPHATCVGPSEPPASGRRHAPPRPGPNGGALTWGGEECQKAINRQSIQLILIIPTGHSHRY